MKNAKFKRAVRARMKRTGETYSTARRALLLARATGVPADFLGGDLPEETTKDLERAALGGDDDG